MILVTGITGLTGRFLYKELKKTDLKYRFLVRNNSDISWMDVNENIVFGDLEEVKDIFAAMAGVSEVLHLAPREKLVNIMMASENNNITRLYYVNSTGIYSKFKSTSHIDLKNEVRLKESKFSYTIIRPTMIYGNHQDGNMQKLIRLMKYLYIYPVLGEGNGLMQPIYAGDLAKFLVSILLNSDVALFKEYNVAGKHPIKYKDVLKHIAKYLNKKVWFIHIPYSLALFIGKIGDKIPNGLIDHEKVLRLVEDKNFDYSEAVKDFNFNPISFEEGIELQIRNMRKQGKI